VSEPTTKPIEAQIARMKAEAERRHADYAATVNQSYVARRQAAEQAARAGETTAQP